MSRDQILRDSMRAATAGVVDPDAARRDLRNVKQDGRGRLRRRRNTRVGVGAGLLVLAGSGAVLAASGSRADQGLTTSASVGDGAPGSTAPAGYGTVPPPPVAGEWRAMSSSPLAERVGATTLWTGSELLVMGG